MMVMGTTHRACIRCDGSGLEEAHAGETDDDRREACLRCGGSGDRRDAPPDDDYLDDD